MNDLYNKINDLNLKRLLQSNPIDGEELLFESKGSVVCSKSGIDEKTEATLFATNARMGFITAKADSYFYANNMKLRDLLSDNDDKLIQLIFADEDNENNTEYDHYINYYASNNYGKFFNSIFNVLNMRFETPMECVIPLINEAIKNIYENKFDKALDLFDEANKLDGRTGVIDLLKAKTLKLMGKDKQAAIMLAKKFSMYNALSLKFIMQELINHQWTPAAIRYLPPLNKGNNYESMLVEALRAKSENKHSEFVNHVLKTATWLRENNYECNVILIFSRLMMLYSNKDTEATLKDICKKLIEIVEELDFGDAPENSNDDMNILREFYKVYQEEPAKAIKWVLYVYSEKENNMSFKLFSEEEYSELLKINFKAEDIKLPSGHTLDDIDEFTFVDNDTLYCESLVYRIFAALRTGIIQPDKILLLLFHLNEKIKEGNNRYLLSQEAMELLLYYVASCETNIRNGLTNEALENITACRKKLEPEFGNYIHPILQYGENVMDFYEAWALGSYAEMENSVADIPQEEMPWIHVLCISVAEELRKKIGIISSSDDALKHLNSLTSKFINISQFDDVKRDTKKQISEYLNKIKLRLNENELRIAVVGETSTGKTTFLNTLFNTDLFFTTQEEATGVPTEIRKGTKTVVEVLDNKGKIRSALNSDKGTWFNNIINSMGADKKDNIGWSVFRKVTDILGSKKNKEDLDNCSPAEFIAKHTKVGESSLNWVDKVKVALPIEELPDNAVIIDTPGFNASYERAEIAKRVIADAHVCIFLIDARNALKNKEMEILQMVREEAGKTFFVLNKMDLVFSDDDLDCDGEDSVDMTLRRVELDLKRYFNLKDVMLYPICCLPREQVRRDALKYCDNLVLLKENIFKEAVVKKVELLVDMAVKEAVTLSNDVVTIGENLISSHLENENKLLQSMPVDPELFKSEIEEAVLGYYYLGRNKYIDSIVETINSELKLASDSFYNWIVEVSSKSTLKSDTQSKAEASIKGAVKRIENARKRELDKLSSNVIKEIENTFRELYSNLPFKASFKSKNLSDYRSTLNLSMIGGLQGTINSISDDITQETTAAVIGAAVGMFLGPLGAIAGGFLGGALFGKPIGEMKEEIWKVYCESIDKTYNRISEAYDKDISNENTQSYVNKLIKVISVEIERYNSEITWHIDLHNENMQKVNAEIIKLKLNAYSIMDEVQVLQKWREQRYLN